MQIHESTPHQIYMFTVTSLAWTYSSLVASQRTQSREKQTERQRDDSVDGGGWWRARLGMRGMTGEETTGTIDVRSRFSLAFLVYSCATSACSNKAHGDSCKLCRSGRCSVAVAFPGYSFDTSFCKLQLSGTVWDSSGWRDVKETGVPHTQSICHTKCLVGNSSK